MHKIVSRRHKIKFYLILAFLSLFSLALSIFMTAQFIKVFNEDAIEPKHALMPVFAIALIGLMIYYLYQYNKNAPKIVIDGDYISFNEETFHLADIENIEFTGKRNFLKFLSTPLESAALHFKNGTTKFIFDDMYENSWQIKSYLRQIVVEKKNFLVEERYETHMPDPENEFFITFKDNQLLSMRGLFLWSLICFVLYISLFNNKKITATAYIFQLAILLIWLIFHAWLMHYFEVSTNYLVIRNHIYVWKRKAFRLQDISEVVYETQGKMPNCLRIITKDLKTKLYPAGTLRDSTWLEMKETLEMHGIKVRNECI